MAREFVLDLLNCSGPQTTQVSLPETLQMFQFKALAETAVRGCGADLPSEMCSHSTLTTAPQTAQRGCLGRASLGWCFLHYQNPVAGGFSPPNPIHTGVLGGSCSPDPTLSPGVASFAIVPCQHFLQSLLQATFPIALNPNVAGSGGDRRDALEKPWAGSRRHRHWGESSASDAGCLLQRA